MTDFARARKMLVKEEGYALKPYKCTAGATTIGIGHNLDANGLTEDVIETIFNHDLNNAYHDAEIVFGKSVFESFSSNRRLALINMLFAMGRTRFMTFKKMRRAAELGDWAAAADEVLDSEWARNAHTHTRAYRVAKMLRGDDYPYGDI